MSSKPVLPCRRPPTTPVIPIEVDASTDGTSSTLPRGRRWRGRPRSGGWHGAANRPRSRRCSALLACESALAEQRREARVRAGSQGGVRRRRAARWRGTSVSTGGARSRTMTSEHGLLRPRRSIPRQTAVDGDAGSVNRLAEVVDVRRLGPGRGKRRITAAAHRRGAGSVPPGRLLAGDGIVAGAVRPRWLVSRILQIRIARHAAGKHCASSEKCCGAAVTRRRRAPS